MLYCSCLRHFAYALRVSVACAFLAFGYTTIMPKFSLTLAAFFFFACAFFLEHMDIFPLSPAAASHVERYRERTEVREGVSQDGKIIIAATRSAPYVPNSLRTANHARTLRAFLPSEGSVLYLEQIKPHKFFAVQGPFFVSPETVNFTWKTPVQIIFYGTTPDGAYAKYVLDLQTHVLESALLTALPISKTRVFVDPDL